MLMYLNEYIHPDVVKLLKQHEEVTDALDRIREIDATILRTTNITRDIISQTSSPKVIVKHGVGYNIINLEAAKKYKILIINTLKANTNFITELIIDLILNVCRDTTPCDTKSRHEGFDRITPPEITDIELTGKTTGLVGIGNITLRTGEALKNGFDTVPVRYDPYCTAEQAAIFGIKRYNDLSKVLEVPDIVSIDVPLASSTKSLIADDSFLHLKRNAVLISVTRGGIVNEDDLYTVLRTRQLRAVARDAFVKEPPTSGSKLTKLSNFCAMSHIGASTEEVLYRMGMEAVRAVIGATEGNAAKCRAVQKEKMAYYE